MTRTSIQEYTEAVRWRYLHSTSTVLLRFEYEIGAWSGPWHYTFHGSHRWGNSDAYSLKDLAGHAQ